MEVSDQLHVPVTLTPGNYPGTRGWVGPKVGLDTLDNRNISLPLPGIELWYLGCAGHSLVTIPTELSRLHLRGSVLISPSIVSKLSNLHDPPHLLWRKEVKLYQCLSTTPRRRRGPWRYAINLSSGCFTVWSLHTGRKTPEDGWHPERGPKDAENTLSLPEIERPAVSSQSPCSDWANLQTSFWFRLETISTVSSI
jgi:hypothetical protein